MAKKIYTKDEIREIIDSCIELEDVKIKEVGLPTIEDNNVYHVVIQGGLNLSELINIGNEFGDNDMLVYPSLFETNILYIYFIPTVEY